MMKRMRQITAVLLAALLLPIIAADGGFSIAILNSFGPYALAEEEKNAFQLRFDIENRYHVSVLLGKECVGVPMSGFELQILPRDPSLFAWMEHGEDQYTEVLRGLDKALSAYPQDFFRNFRSAAGESARLQFLIGDRIIRGGQAYGGMTASDGAGHSSVFLAANAADIEASVHHVLWYAMEERILLRAPMALRDWKNLNPKDFAYEEEESILPEEAMDPNDWFVGEDSKLNEKEDRATVFEAYMTRDDAWWEGKPHLQAKLKFLLLRIRGVFKGKGTFQSFH